MCYVLGDWFLQLEQLVQRPWLSLRENNTIFTRSFSYWASGNIKDSGYKILKVGKRKENLKPVSEIHCCKQISYRQLRDGSTNKQIFFGGKESWPWFPPPPRGLP